MSRASLWTAAGAAVAAGLLRIIPMPSNLAPVGALGLFGGARLRSRYAFALPMAVMAASDLLLWLIRGWQPFDPFVYASFLVYVVIARLLCRKRSLWRVGAASVLGSTQFFLITNFGAWLELSTPSLGIYPRSAAGLWECYLAGLPFAGPTVISDLGFTFLLLGVYAVVLRIVRARQLAAQVEPAA